jgi:preprotein translocase subunit SecF
VVIYDTSVKFAQIQAASVPDLLNSAVNSTLSRSIITRHRDAGAAPATFGGTRLQHRHHDFRRGVVGTYTSVFIAAPSDLSWRRHHACAAEEAPERRRLSVT